MALNRFCIDEEMAFESSGVFYKDRFLLDPECFTRSEYDKGMKESVKGKGEKFRDCMLLSASDQP